MIEDEQEDVEENFVTHEEKINLLVTCHIKLDCDEEMLELAKIHCIFHNVFCTV